MEIELNQEGDPQSAFIKACSGRHLNLTSSGDSPHPLQIIPAQWRAVKASFGKFVDELASVESTAESNGDLLLQLFRQMVYDATELFDSYAILVPSRCQGSKKEVKAAIAEFKRTAQRLRADCAKLCNRCKHHGAQLKFLWARSPSNGLTGSRVLVSCYNGRGGLVRDDKIHGGKMAGIGLVRWAQELAHNLLRIDRAAGVLIEKLIETDCEPMLSLPPSLPVGASMRKLSEIRATRYADEPSLHDGLSFSQTTVSLIRVRAVDFGPSANIVASLTIEAGTTEYSIA